MHVDNRAIIYHCIMLLHIDGILISYIARLGQINTQVFLHLLVRVAMISNEQNSIMRTAERTLMCIRVFP